MYHTKEDLQRHLAELGLKGDETILVHSSMKAIGAVEGGADTVIDALTEYFAEGLLLLPTHTWGSVNEENPLYDVNESVSNVGILPEIFRKRAGVIRSAHPTHSMAGYGRNAGAYLRGEEWCNTPCTPGGCYDRLKDVGGKILLIGVGHERNTYIHSVEEVLNVPNRLSDEPMKLKVIMADGAARTVYMRRHYNAVQPHISEDFVKLTQAFLDCKAAKNGRFGSAECILCDARKVFEVTRQILAPDPQCLITAARIPEERWKRQEGGDL